MNSSPIRFTGLTSGMDTQSMVQQLMRAESLKMDRLTRRRQLLLWRQEQLRSTMTVFDSFRTQHTNPNNPGTISNPGNQAWNTIETAVNLISGAAGGGIKVMATNSAPLTKVDIEVVQTAQAALVRGSTQFRGVGADTMSADAINLDAALRSVDSSLAGGGSGTIKIFDGIKEVEIAVDEDMTMRDVMRKINESNLHVTMTFDSHRGRFTLTNDQTGARSQIRVGSDGGFGDALMSFIGFENVSTSPIANATITTLPSGLVINTETLGSLMGGVSPGTTYQFAINNRVIGFDESDTLEKVFDEINKVTDGMVTITYDSLSGNLTFRSEGDLSIEANNSPDAAALISALNGGGASQITASASPVTDPRVIRYGQDAIIYLDGTSTTDGIRWTQGNNVFWLGGDWEGITVDISEARPNQVYTIETSRNVEPAMDEIRKFVEEYNNLIRHLNSLHTTARPRSGNPLTGKLYEPLTDEERQGMSDRDLERWEEQAKTGLLHRDRDIRNIQQKLRELMMQPVNLNGGGTFSLFQAGIQTVGFNGAKEDRLIGVLEIDEDRLRAALEQNPDAVRQVFSRHHAEAVRAFPNNAKDVEDNIPHLGVSLRIHEYLHSITQYDKTSPLRQRVGSADGSGIDANSNIISRQLREYDSRIDQMNRYLIRRENHYYAMFARMEQAMAQSHAQMDSLFAFMQQ